MVISIYNTIVQTHITVKQIYYKYIYIFGRKPPSVVWK